MPMLNRPKVEPPSNPPSPPPISTPSPEPSFETPSLRTVQLQSLAILEPSSPSPMALGRPLPLFIASIGNPGAQYAHTLHSAGHTVLARLALHLNYPPLTRDSALAKGLASRPPTPTADAWTLWQSPTYMNDSGKAVRAAFVAWSKSLPEGGEGRLVVLHDELEKPLGAVTVKTDAAASAKGHNGIKSVKAYMGKTPFVRIGVGIGRPGSRESGDVAQFVLRRMSGAERGVVETCVGDVVRALRGVEMG